MASTKSCQHFRHVVDGEFIGQRLETGVWGEIKCHLRHGQPIQHHVAREEALWMRCIGLMDLTEMGVNLVEGHAPLQSFNAGLNGLDSPEDEQRRHQADQCCLQSVQHHSLVLISILPRGVTRSLKRIWKKQSACVRCRGDQGMLFKA